MRVYTSVVSVIALMLTLALASRYPIGNWMPVLVLLVLTSATENYAFELPLAGSVSLSFAVTYAAMLYAGPLAAVICAIAGSTNVREFREGKPLVLRLFNVGQLALTAGISGIVYALLGGRFLVMGPDSGASLLPAIAGALAFFLVNVILVGYGASILSGRPFGAILREQGFLSYGASWLVLGLLGLMVAHLLALGSWIGLLLLVLPFLAARRTFRVYVELTEAYNSTVRSLVAAIEAKDPYTRGHSERVAIYSRRLAERLMLPRAEVDLVERAALLHDVGKIGIDVDTLTSPVQLAAEEVRSIRMHPVLGSELVGDVEFLSDIVPIIRHHHERFDGAGYPDGLVGSRIPQLARVLSVADSYDAMTSDRAYRPGMTSEQALTELARVAGTQLDESITHHFSSMLLDETTGVS
jgi:putative nucleotidyltransferase with HDIG domain